MNTLKQRLHKAHRLLEDAARLDDRFEPARAAVCRLTNLSGQLNEHDYGYIVLAAEEIVTHAFRAYPERVVRCCTCGQVVAP